MLTFISTARTSFFPPYCVFFFFFFYYFCFFLFGSFFFFFQAEDGIRDIGVTGVQTCALPISASLMISHNMDHLEQAISATTEANNRQADRPERWDDRPYIPDHLDEPVAQRSDTPTEAPPREEVQESPESPESPGPRSHHEPSTGRAETQGAENSRQDNPIVIDLENVDAISITTLSDVDPEELD